MHGMERGMDSGGRGKTLNRRDRDSYNAYQRFYMQTMRAIKAGRACEWRTNEQGTA